MMWIEAAAIAAIVEYLVFGALVGRARGRYGVVAPAVTGHPAFERLYRVQMNTLELLVAFFPALALAARHAPAPWVAGLGFVFVGARAWYASAYARDPKRRNLPFALSIGAVFVLVALAAFGAWRDLGAL